MPPRRKPTSQNAKKAAQKLKKAIKRGDVEVPQPSTKKPNHKRKGRVKIGPSGEIMGSAGREGNVALIESSRKLQSAFIKLPPQFLEQTKSLASTLILPRPIPSEVAIFAGISQEGAKDLSCPARPKWRFDMTKKEVESNEEGVYKKWLADMDDIVQTWQNAGQPLQIANPAKDEDFMVQPPTEMPRSATYFERNLEVWRQLWRVTEISQIILVLLDSRCPLLHYPPSLHTYLSNRTDLRIILVLTKVDISGQVRADAWSVYFQANYPGIRVVQVEAYGEKAESAAHQGRKMFEPRLPHNFRQRLVQTIREVHAEMLEPPEKVKNSEAWLKRWKPPVKQDINWKGVLEAGGGNVGGIVGGAAAPKPKEDEHGPEETNIDREYQEPEFLTIGLIGQPNVGKSSLLNALFNTHKVRASKTPGKTKHFQTLFWTPDVRLVDCPGLVMPNFVPMEMQVLAGILPISRVSAIPSCIHHAAKLLPIEQVYNLVHPILNAPPVEDKRTWRDGLRSNVEDAGQANPPWHAMDILTAYADAKGWVTAKAGRSDVHRAGNALLRALAEARVPWAFWPPGTDPSTVSAEAHDVGIWIPRPEPVEEDSEEESEEEDEPPSPTVSQADSETEEESDEDEAPFSGGGGMFSALAMKSVDEEEGDETPESEDSTEER